MITFAQDADWPCTSVWYLDTADTSGGAEGTWKEGTLVSFFDENGNQYYAMKITNGELGPDGNPTADMFNGSHSVRVSFTVQAPDTTEDTSRTVSIGGASIEGNMGTPADKETDLLNNWAESRDPNNPGDFHQVELAVGSVQATGAQIADTATNEDVRIQLDFSVSDGQGDSIQSVTINSMADGATLVDAAGNVLVTSAGGTLSAAQVAAGVYYKPAPDSHGSQDISYSVTVQDDKSLDTKVFEDQTATVVVTAVADQPTGVDAGDADVTGAKDALASGGEVTFAVSAVFGDISDGSEAHYILVEKPGDGWTCDGSTGTIEVDGVTYFTVKVPANATYTDQTTDPITGEVSGTATVNVTLTAPDQSSANALTGDGTLELQVGALAHEQSYGDLPATVDSTNTGNGLAVSIGDQVGFDYATVSTTEANVTPIFGSVSEDAEGAAGASLQFALNGADTDEVITGIQITDLAGGRIWDATLNNGQGGYMSETTPLTLDVENGALPDGRYTYVPAENKSGTINLGVSVTVTDTKSNDTKTITDIEMPLAITPVTDMPESLVDSEATGLVIGTGHTATVSITLEADFVDHVDNSETHYFLVKLPANATFGSPLPQGVELLDASDPRLGGEWAGQSPVYLVTAAAGADTATLSLTLLSGFTPDSVEYRAGSYENALYGGSGADTNGAVKVTLGDEGIGSVAIDANGTAFNQPPTVSVDPDASGVVVDSLRNPDGALTGTVSLTDPDSQAGDNPSVVSGKFGEDGAVVEAANGKLVLEGDYGILTIDTVNNTYTYELKDNVTVPKTGATETFTVTGQDDYAGNPLSHDATISFSVTNTNTGPEAREATFLDTAAGGTVGDADVGVASGWYQLLDDDSDKVEITGIELNGGMVTPTFDSDTGNWTIEGNYGILVMSRTESSDGSYKYWYEYTQTDEYASGTDSFNIHFTEILRYDNGVPVYGESGEGAFNVEVSPLNHAPNAADLTWVYDWGSQDNYQHNLVLSDSDAGDSAHVAFVSFGDGEPVAVGANGWTEIKGEHGTLQITADGEFIYTPDKGNPSGAGEWETFTYTAHDSSGAATEATIRFGHGVDDLSTGIHNDVSGGVGSDILVGTSGIDTFRWTLDDLPDHAGTTYRDVIKDFNLVLDGGSDGDVIDLSALGLNGDDLKAGATMDGDHLVLSFTVPTGNETTGTQQIVLENAASFYSGDPGDPNAAQALIEQMIHQQQIKLAGGSDG